MKWVLPKAAGVFPFTLTIFTISNFWVQLSSFHGNFQIAGKPAGKPLCRSNEGKSTARDRSVIVVHIHLTQI